ncbi:MAG: maleylacetate reductase [Thermoleophilaceae bacterium]|nr:maleylacetate reductase [Thermoleophilaceae bacterium]
MEEAPGLLRARGFEEYALLTTERFSGHALAEGAGAVIDVPSGPVPEVSAAARDAVDGRPVVALGGGRVIDSAKAIGAADGVPVAAVPTTLSGAELTGFHRLPEGVEGRSLVRPSLVIADPALMASAPMPLLAATALNALAHAVEALYTPLASPVPGMAALRGANLIASGLDGEGEPQRAEREALALGALLAGYASGSTGYAVHHVVCQTIVRVGGTPHADTNATMLPHTLRLMRGRAPDEIARVERELGGRDAAARLAARAEVSGLRALGFDGALIDEVVAAVLPRPELANTPDPPGEPELRAYVEGAL